jgi:hypothetical protein
MNVKRYRPEVIPSFSVPIVAFDLPDCESINAGLRERVLERRTTDQGLVRSNVMSWHSGEDLVDWGGSGAKLLAETCGNICSGLTELPESGPHSLRWVVRMWANVCESGAFNRQHFHPGAYWSAVYYVSDGRRSRMKTWAVSWSFTVRMKRSHRCMHRTCTLGCLTANGSHPH